MTKKDWFGIGYVSIWVLIWGTIGSLIDLPLLQANVYEAGTTGQYLTFLITALISILLGIWLFPKALNNNWIIKVIGDGSDQKK